MVTTDKFRELFDLLPRCKHYEHDATFARVECQRTATRQGTWQDDGCEVYCDEHAGGECDQDDEPGAELPWAHIVRREGALQPVRREES